MQIVQVKQHFFSPESKQRKSLMNGSNHSKRKRQTFAIRPSQGPWRKTKSTQEESNCTGISASQFTIIVYRHAIESAKQIPVRWRVQPVVVPRRTRCNDTPLLLQVQ